MDEVDTFLDALREDYEKIFRSNSNFKEQVIILKEKLDHYTNMESTLQNTLVLAQTAAQQAKENSEKEASIMVREAEREADSIIKEADKRISEINKEYEFMKQQFNAFKSRFKGMVESQLETIERIQIETGIVDSIGVTREEMAFLENPKVLEQVAVTTTIEKPKANDQKPENKKEDRNETRPDYRKDYKKDYRKDYNKQRYNQKKPDKIEV